MMKRIALFVLFAALIHPILACGGKNGSSLTDLDQQLTGQWASESPNPQGDTLMLLFEPTEAERTVKVQAIRPTGDAINVDAGIYSISDGRIQFALGDMGNLDLPFALRTESEINEILTIGDEVYYKISPGGVVLSGQLRLTDLSADEYVSVSSIIPRHVPGEILVDEGPSPGSQALSLGRAGSGLRRVKIKLPERSALSLEVASLGQGVTQILDQQRRVQEAELQALEDCRRQGKRCSFNAILKSQSVPNDTYWDAQWAMRLLNMAAVFDDEAELTAGDPVVVAVIDTGIALEALSDPEFQDRFLYRQNNGTVLGHDFVTHEIKDPETGEIIDGNFSLDGNDIDQYPYDECDQRDMGIPGSNCSWHGTHLAGIIGAVQNNGGGIFGMSRNVKILPVRAIGRDGDGTIFDVAQAIYWACGLPNIADCELPEGTFADPDGNGVAESTCPAGFPTQVGRPIASVINLSLGLAMTEQAAETLLDAIHACVRERQTLFVAAAGNDGLGPGYCQDPANPHRFYADEDCKFYPAADPSVISVGAVTGSGAYASSYSNYGGSPSDLWVVAPGGAGEQGVLSTIKPGLNGGYFDLIGTSQSAAHVSGLAALIKAHKPGITLIALANLIKNTAIYLGGNDPWDPDFGYGLINPRGALLTSLGITPTGSPELTTSVNGLHFGKFGEKATVILYNAGGSVLQFQNAEIELPEGEDWLKVEPKQLDAPFAPWSLSVSIDRTDLDEGNYSGKVRILTNGGEKEIEVTMKVDDLNIDSAQNADVVDDLIRRANSLLGGTGDYENTQNIGELWVLAINTETEAAYKSKTTFASNYNFYLNLPPGKYQIVAGVDENNDRKICDEGDSICLGYPTYEELTTIDCSSGTCNPTSIIINR